MKLSSKKRRGEKRKKWERRDEKSGLSRGRRRGRDRGAGALFLWEDPMHNLDSQCTGVKGECACGYYSESRSGGRGGRERGGDGGLHACEREREREREREKVRKTRGVRS